MNKISNQFSSIEQGCLQIAMQHVVEREQLNELA